MTASRTTAYARNQWYVAAYGREVGRELLGRTLLGEPVVLYRSEEDGRVIALADRCVHRRYPLSASRLDGDRVVCGYHGFTYDASGTCVYVPGQKRIPRTARVQSYPVVEQDSFVWVWIGDAELADPAAIPRAPWLADPRWVTIGGMEPIDADYGLLVDNLMDLSHETYLHGGYIGTPEVAETPITTEVDEGAGIVRVSRHMDDAECPPFYARSTGIEGRITRWQDIEYHAPCLYLLTAGSPRSACCQVPTATTAAPSTPRSLTPSPRRATDVSTTSGPSRGTSR
jgi:vanillate O-demethylase monooxygenase subunit